MTQRTDRIDELLRQEIGSILARDVADPRIGFATITRVETAPDLRHARVWVSVIGDAAARDETIAALGRAMGFVRRELGTRLRLKRIPDLHVRLDETAERGTRVLQLLHEIEEGRLPEDLPPPGESLPTPVPRLPREGDTAEPGADGLAAARDVPPARPPRRRQSRGNGARRAPDGGSKPRRQR
ncbi:MAG TPA: 30S ribosome-binding factor RbfA [Candidatus Limnocylindrales bacterium]